MQHSKEVRKIIYLLLMKKTKKPLSDEMKDKILDEYKNTYVGIKKLHHKLKDEGVKQSDIKETLKNNPIYEAYLPYNKKYNSFVATHPFQEFQIDLMFITSNKSDIPILMCIDVFTKYVCGEILKNKESKPVVDAMKKIFKDMKGTPKTIYCDEGSEFINSEFQKLMTQNNIEILFTRKHAPFIERVIGTIKKMLYKHLNDKGFSTFSHDIFKKVVDDYNNSYHSTIKMTPYEAHNYKSNVDEVHRNILLKAHIGKVKPHTYKEGDLIRFIKNNSKFKRGFEPIWTLSTYTIEKIEGEYVYLKGRDKAVLINQIKPAKKETVEQEFKDTQYENLKKEKRQNQYLKRMDIKAENVIQKKTRQQTKLDNLRNRLRSSGIDVPRIVL